MSIDEKVDPKRLEDLAISFARNFLEATRKNPQKVISLYGCDQDVLNSIRNIMEHYLNNNGKSISVVLGRKGYGVDVGFFLD